MYEEIEFRFCVVVDISDRVFAWTKNKASRKVEVEKGGRREKA